MQIIRSFLFAPGSNSKLMQKALTVGADAIIFDLEDAVAVSEKEKARALAAEIVGRGEHQCLTYIRINSWDTSWAKADLAAAINAGVGGIMLPKAEDPAVVKAVAGLLPPNVDFIPLVETAKGILNAYAIADCSDRVSRLAFGAIDFTLDIGADYSKTGTELLYARSQLVVASRAAGLLPPVDTVFPDLADSAGLETELNRVKQLGMFGKLAIHPKQISPINQLFTPSAEEIEDAIQVIKAFEEAQNKGVASIEINGKFVDYPVVAKAKRLIELSKLKRAERVD
ncbi:citrate lyase subunit beta/citryl-CoA lyase [Geothermobacter ehrlichii]|uniref:Citrate lyase subunit beta/citryl-CoA lyase n=1 Tax=Geothermobacter ehrlichii TaxID=213224 RepID=A0A5D3WE60_9BACT|nr:CoA ester lyase [Geothermobacter ehrlichii]TYO94891.1 citrate lyase subunit beta/citryl-CoA lyase [Geothermobacter ehrlichii]